MSSAGKLLVILILLIVHVQESVGRQPAAAAEHVASVEDVLRSHQSTPHASASRQETDDLVSCSVEL